MDFNYFICNKIEPKDSITINFECNYMANIVQKIKRFDSDIINCVYRNSTRSNSIIFYIDLKGKSLYMGMIMHDSKKIINDNTTEKDMHIALEPLSDMEIENISRLIYISKNIFNNEDIYFFNNIFYLALSNKLKNKEFIIDYRLLDSEDIKIESYKEEFKRIIDKYIL